MDKEIARSVVKEMQNAIQKMEDSLVFVRNGCSTEEFAAYRYGIGHALSEIHDRILDPIIREHPDLLPEDVDYVPPAGPTMAEMIKQYRS